MLLSAKAAGSPPPETAARLTSVMAGWPPSVAAGTRASSVSGALGESGPTVCEVWQLTVWPAASQVHSGPVAETSCIPSGSVSTTVIGPALGWFVAWTFSVYACSRPAWKLPSCVFTSVRSAPSGPSIITGTVLLGCARTPSGKAAAWKFSTPTLSTRPAWSSSTRTEKRMRSDWLGCTAGSAMATSSALASLER